MLIRTIHAELYKLRRSPLPVVFLLLPLLPAVMGTFNYLQNTEILTHQWYDLWSQHTLFYCYFFLPALIGVCCAYLFRLEHRNHNWNAVMTVPIPTGLLFTAKLTASAVMILLAQLTCGALFVVCGFFAGLQAAIPSELLFWLLQGWCGGLAVAAVQLFLSLVIRSFAVPVGIALLGGITGLAAAAKGLGAYVPYCLPCIGMAANNPNAASVMMPAAFYLSCMAFVVLFAGASLLWLRLRDVKTY